MKEKGERRKEEQERREEGTGRRNRKKEREQSEGARRVEYAHTRISGSFNTYSTHMCYACAMHVLFMCPPCRKYVPHTGRGPRDTYAYRTLTDDHRHTYMRAASSSL